MRLGSSLSASMAIHGAALALIAATPYVAPMVPRPLTVDRLPAVGPASPPASAVARLPAPRARGTPRIAVSTELSAAMRDPGGAAMAEPAAPPPGVVPGRAAPAAVAATPPGYDAAYLDNPAPAYPPAARRRRSEGIVLLDVAVDAGGGATAVAVAESAGDELLDRAATDAVRVWRFVPARRDGEAVAGRVRVPVRFRLDR